MDNITHTLVGAALGQAGLKRKTGLAMPALLIGANLPDVDVSCFLWLDGLEHLAFRRGITHGPIAWFVLPLVLAGLLWWFDRWQQKRGTRPEARLPVSFGWLYALSFIACLTHPALDWLNVYGIRLLEPFSSRWFYGDVLFIIDVWLWVGLGLALWLSLRREKGGGNWQRPAKTGLAGALAYVGLNVAITSYHYDYEKYYDRRAIWNPVPVLFFHRELLTEQYENLWTSTSWDGAPQDYPGKNTACFGNCRQYPDSPVCDLTPALELRASYPSLDAFLFWSRAPFAERAEDGSVVIHDARFYEPQAKGRFSVSLPEVQCEQIAP